MHGRTSGVGAREVVGDGVAGLLCLFATAGQLDMKRGIVTSRGGAYCDYWLRLMTALDGILGTFYNWKRGSRG